MVEVGREAAGRPRAFLRAGIAVTAVQAQFIQLSNKRRKSPRFKTPLGWWTCAGSARGGGAEGWGRVSWVMAGEFGTRGGVTVNSRGTFIGFRPGLFRLFRLKECR